MARSPRDVPHGAPREAPGKSFVGTAEAGEPSAMGRCRCRSRKERARSVFDGPNRHGVDQAVSDERRAPALSGRGVTNEPRSGGLLARSLAL